MSKPPGQRGLERVDGGNAHRQDPQPVPEGKLDFQLYDFVLGGCPREEHDDGVRATQLAFDRLGPVARGRQREAPKDTVTRLRQPAKDGLSNRAVGFSAPVADEDASQSARILGLRNFPAKRGYSFSSSTASCFAAPPSGRSTSSRMAISAASPRRKPLRTMRVYPPLRSS